MINPHHKALFTNPASTADGFAAQLQSVGTDCLDKLVPLRHMRRRASKSSAKWLSAEAVAAKRRRRRLERKRNRSEMTVLLTVPPAVMLMCSITGCEKITCDPNSKPAPTPVNVGRWPKGYFILTISTQNNLLQLMILDFANNFPNILFLKSNYCAIVFYVN